MNEEELTKIHIDLPNHWAIGGESLWAKPLGDNLYQIENIPFFAYGFKGSEPFKSDLASATLRLSGIQGSIVGRATGRTGKGVQTYSSNRT